MSLPKDPDHDLGLIYRQGSVDDLAAVYELNCNSFSESWTFSGLKDALESEYELCVCLDNKFLAGYLLSHDILDEVHIMQVAVASTYRRKGIAEQLSRNLLDAKTGRKLLLEVRASNASAQALYGKLGFICSGVRKDYYVPSQESGVREDAILMSFQQVD
ncbi:MAG: ribosomal protein S18-alanine N-acetyltransferase [Mariprofundaceae bacterium]